MSNVYFRFALYIVAFSTIVSIGTSLINYNVQYRDLDRDILEESGTMAENIRRLLRFDIQGVEKDLFAISNSPLFRNYLAGPDASAADNAIDLLLSHAEANDAYFQVRFLDASGMERIRIDKDRVSLESAALPAHMLQDKSGRYYFRETMGLGAGQTWRSRLDLNVEHGKIEQPIRPTLRVATPVFHDGAAVGMLIINVDMSSTLSLISKDPDFKMYLIDNDGYFLIHADAALNWSRYLNTDARVQTTWPARAEQLLSRDSLHADNLHSFSLENEFRNGEHIRVVLQAQNAYVAALKRNNLKVALYLALMILAIAIPVGMLLAVRPAQIQKALRDALDENARQLAIIDKYVPTFATDRDGAITDISRALCQLSGYDRPDVVGKPLTDFINPDGSEDFLKNAAPNVHSGLIWHGEIQGKARDGESLWLEATVLPELRDGQVSGINVVSVDVTDKKRIARLSERDHLTGIYNRIKLDEVLSAESARVQRYQTRFSAILLDADHFKSVNDNYGHLVGDLVLKSIAGILQAHTRNTDVVGRWGGEEFMVMCLETTLEGARELAEKLREAIAEHDFEQVPHQTASFGVSEYSADETLAAFVKRMDDALYTAKDSGRNRVVAS